MAPPIINDTRTLLEIAIITLEQPHLKFAAAYRKAIQIAPPRQHSADSCRRRLQRKFNRKRSYWLWYAQSELQTRRAEQRRQFQKDMASIAKSVTPVIEVLNRIGPIKPPPQTNVINKLGSCIKALKQMESFTKSLEQYQIGKTISQCSVGSSFQAFQQSLTPYSRSTTSPLMAARVFRH